MSHHHLYVVSDTSYQDEPVNIIFVIYTKYKQSKSARICKRKKVRKTDERKKHVSKDIREKSQKMDSLRTNEI